MYLFYSIILFFVFLSLKYFQIMKALKSKLRTFPLLQKSFEALRNIQNFWQKPKVQQKKIRERTQTGAMNQHEPPPTWENVGFNPKMSILRMCKP